MGMLTAKLLTDIFENDDTERAYSRCKLYQVEVDDCYVHPEKHYFVKRSDGLWILFFNPELFIPTRLELIRIELDSNTYLYSGYFTVDLSRLFAIGGYDTYEDTLIRLKENADEYVKRYYRYSYDK